jgi:hypothetical protein
LEKNKKDAPDQNDPSGLADGTAGFHLENFCEGLSTIKEANKK